MKIRFEVSITLDTAVVTALAARTHRPAPAALEELVADIELRLSDAPKYLDGVARTTVSLVEPQLKPRGVTEHDTRQGGDRWT